MWDTKTGVPYGSPLTVDTSPVNEVEFSPDGRTLVTAHQGSAVVWNMSGDHVLGATLGGPTDLTTGVSFGPDGMSVAAGRLDGSVVVYDTETRREARRFEVGSVVSAVAFHPAGDLIAVGTIDGKVRLLDPQSGTAVASLLEGGRSAVWQVVFSPDGRRLAVAVDPNGVDGFYVQQRQGEVQLWDVDSRRRVGRTIVPGAGSVFAVAFNGDGTLLATGSGGQLDLWDVARQARHGTSMKVSDDGVISVAFDSGGSLVAGGGATGPVRVWRVADQRPAFPPAHRAHGSDHRCGVRPGRRAPRDDEPVRGDQALGSGYGPRLRRRIGQPETGLVCPHGRPAVPWLAERVQPGRQAAGRLGRRDTRDAVGGGSRGLA